MREIPDLLLYLWLCAPCVRHQLYIVGVCAHRGVILKDWSANKKTFVIGTAVIITKHL